ncbi:hypothetical protein IFM89_039021 [Coptis chinensis]|uniref:Pentatricopeptide repeat-containing protein n=1 Tax=Coptis chinensis TaxID=261450 RepID=A0A835IIR1_9MAGN|nr:hypothetical protein IFM89_039021 [Coptis chinensis]
MHRVGEPRPTTFAVSGVLKACARMYDKVCREPCFLLPMQPNVGVWGALLLACRLHNNVELGEIAAQHCIELGPHSSRYCSLLANI